MLSVEISKKRKKKKKTYKQTFSKEGIYYMKKYCPVYSLSFVKDQTQDHKTWTIRPLDKTHAIGKGDVYDGGTVGTNPRGRLAILQSPYHLIN